MLSAMNEIAILQKVQHPRVVSVQVGPVRLARSATALAATD
jgi:hypothetical protein